MIFARRFSDDEEYDPIWMDKEKFMESNTRCPCMYESRNKKGEKQMKKPAVDCDFNCPYCGWNPEEQKRRLEKGRFTKDEPVLVHVYADEDDKVGEMTAVLGILHLVFPEL